MIVELEQVTPPPFPTPIPVKFLKITATRGGAARLDQLCPLPILQLRLPSVLFPVISLLTDKPKCSSKVSPVASNWWWSNGSKFTTEKILPRSFGEEIETIFLISRIICARYCFLSSSPRFGFSTTTIECVRRSCRNTCWMENEVFEARNEKRSPGDRLSKCLIVIAVLSSVGRESNTKYTAKRNQRGIRITGLCIGSPACISIVTKPVPFISFSFFFHAGLLEFLRVTFTHILVIRRIMKKWNENAS